MIARKYWQLHAVSLTGWDMLWHHSQTMTHLWSFCAWIKIRFPAVGSVMATACVLMEACSWPWIASLLFECLKRRAEEGIDHGLGDWAGVRSPGCCEWWKREEELVWNYCECQELFQAWSSALLAAAASVWISSCCGESWDLCWW